MESVVPEDRALLESNLSAGDDTETRGPEDWGRPRLRSLFQNRVLVEKRKTHPWLTHRFFGGPVLDYLGRYTHRIAISNHRLLELKNGRVSFTWKNYKQGGRRQTMALEATEFIRRFLLHTLPGGFVRIRFYGLLANAHRAEKMKRCRELLAVEPEAKNTDEEVSKPNWIELLRELTGRDPLACPKCKQGRLVRIQTLNIPSRDSPVVIMGVDSS